MDAAAAYLATLGLDEASSTTTTTSKKKDNKKKKKGNKKNKEEEKQPAKISAAAKRLLEQQAVRKAEEERLEKERLELERKEQEEEEKRLALVREKEEKAQRKKEAKKARIEQQKRDGTYLTKTERARQEKAKLALEAMQKQRGVKILGMEGEEEEKAEEEERGNRARTSFKTKRNSKSNAAAAAAAAKAKQEEEDRLRKLEEERKQAEEKEDEIVVDSWEDASDDDWETSDIISKLEDISATNAEGDEDLLVMEQRKEMERLRVQGEMLKKKEEEDRILAEERERLQLEVSKAKLEAEQKKRDAAKRREKREEEARAAVSEDNLRSPICCIMGHVDTGKTKLLDNIRRTNVQDAEAGGITQQIGATFFPRENIMQKTALLEKSLGLKYNLPGLLVIDTPGHESFTNLRSRGSSLCDIAILVVDIMHGLEPQTLESLRLLRSKRAPFVVALNKVDRCYGWVTCPDMPFRDALAKQNDHVKREFRDRFEKIKVEFAEQKLNCDLYWENKDLGHTISIIPTSAISGEGVPDLLALISKLTQEKMAKSLAFVDIVECTVLEVKVMEGLGTTVDSILVNGTLREGDRIIVCTLDGPVETTIRSLLTPHPMKEIRVKGEYLHHPVMKAAMGIKICAQGLEKAVAGTAIQVVGPDDDVEELRDLVMADLDNVLNSIQTTRRGVMVQASTLGAMEALLEFLRSCDPPIPVAGVNLGPVHKKDVTRASVQLEHQPEFATILAFDVKVEKDAIELSKENGVRIFTADIIYHLFDQFTAYMEGIRQSRREEFEELAVFPVVLRIMPNHIINKKDPIILGVDVEEGILKVGTPLVAIVDGRQIPIGKVSSIQRDHKEIDLAKKASSVAVRIEGESSVMVGRHFEAKHKLYSKLSRASIDALKENFKKDLAKEDWQLVIKLKKVFDII